MSTVFDPVGVRSNGDLITRQNVKVSTASTGVVNGVSGPVTIAGSGGTTVTTNSSTITVSSTVAPVTGSGSTSWTGTGNASNGTGGAYVYSASPYAKSIFVGTIFFNINTTGQANSLVSGLLPAAVASSLLGVLIGSTSAYLGSVLVTGTSFGAMSAITIGLTGSTPTLTIELNNFQSMNSGAYIVSGFMINYV